MFITFCMILDVHLINADIIIIINIVFIIIIIIIVTIITIIITIVKRAEVLLVIDNEEL